MRRSLLPLLVAMVAISPLRAHAQVPGDVCTTPNFHAFSAGPESSGAGHFMVCQGSVWRSLLSFNNTAQVTRIGDQVCGTNEILKFNGATWACAVDAAAAVGPINDLTDAYADYTTNYNFVLGRPAAAALAAGADGNTFISGGAATGAATTDYNTSVGISALGQLTSGGNNTAIGAWSSGYNESGGGNVSIGQAALQLNVASNANVAIGDSALRNATSQHNTALGTSAGVNITTGQQNLVIGFYSHAPSPTADHQLNIGNIIYGTAIDGTGTTLSTGNIGIGEPAPASKLHVRGELRIDNDASTTNKGCLRYDGTGNRLQYSHDCVTFVDLGAPSGGGVTAQTTGNCTTASTSGATCTTAACSAGYFRSGCSAYNSNVINSSLARPTGSACECANSTAGSTTTCYIYCVQ